MSELRELLPGPVAAQLDLVRGATRSLTRAAREADPEAVSEAVEARAAALEQIGSWFAAQSGAEAKRLHRRLAGELESSLVEARDALDRMRDVAKQSLDAVREARVVRGYAGGDSARKSASLDRAG